jgi:hypothetical protein
VSTPQQAMFFFSSSFSFLFLFYTYLLIVSLQIVNKYGIKKKKTFAVGALGKGSLTSGSNKIFNFSLYSDSYNTTVQLLLSACKILINLLSFKDFTTASVV